MKFLPALLVVEGKSQGGVRSLIVYEILCHLDHNGNNILSYTDDIVILT